MKNEELKRLAHEIKMECIFGDGDGVCIRPMHFDDDGRRVVRYRPDPFEFESRESATRRLLMFAKMGL